MVLMQKATAGPEQPAKKRKLLSKKATTAPSLTQQRAPAHQTAAAAGEPAETPEIGQRKPQKGRKPAQGKTQPPAQAAERQTEACQALQAGPAQVTRRHSFVLINTTCNAMHRPPFC